MKKFIVAATIAATATIPFASSASADKPTTFTDNPPTFTEPDPCDPSKVMETTLTIELSKHEGHRNNFVFTGKLTAETSNGYVGSGPLREVGGSQFFSFTQRIMVTNPDTGQRYLVRSHFIGNPNGVIVDYFDIVCLRGFVSPD